MKVKLIQSEIFMELVGIATTSNPSGKSFINSKIYSAEQLENVKSKLMILIDRMNHAESVRYFPYMYSEGESMECDIPSPDEQGEPKL